MQVFIRNHLHPFTQKKAVIYQTPDSYFYNIDYLNKSDIKYLINEHVFDDEFIYEFLSKL